MPTLLEWSSVQAHHLSEEQLAGAVVVLERGDDGGRLRALRHGDHLDHGLHGGSGDLHVGRSNLRGGRRQLHGAGRAAGRAAPAAGHRELLHTA